VEECRLGREQDIGASDIVQGYKGRGESTAPADDDVSAFTELIKRLKQHVLYCQYVNLL